MQSLPAHEARSAGDGERDHHAMTGADPGDLAADLRHDPHRLMTKEVALPQKRAHVKKTPAARSGV
jgi:hypothetical protein